MPNLFMFSSTNQYTEPPIDIPNEPIQEPQAEKPKEKSKSISKYIYIAVGLIILAVIVYFVFFSGTDQKNTDNSIDNGGGQDNLGNNNEPGNTAPDLSRNGVCDPLENCFDNPTECKCSSDEYCSLDTKKCAKPSCGNGKCEVEGIESSETCCLDCPCTIPGQVCNEQTKACEAGTTSLTGERAVELVKAYYENQGLSVDSAESLGVYSYNEELVQRVKVRLAGEEFSRQLVVTDSEEVIDLNTT